MQENNPYASPAADVAQPNSSDVVLAGRLARFVGAMIDTLILFALLIPLLMYSGHWQLAMAGQESVIDVAMMSLLSISVFLTINGYLLAKRGQTVGKIITKIRIVDNETNKLLPFVRVYGLRYLPLGVITYVGTLGSLIALVDILFVFSVDRRCLHDIIAGSKVIKVN